MYSFKILLFMYLKKGELSTAVIVQLILSIVSLLRMKQELVAVFLHSNPIFNLRIVCLHIMIQEVAGVVCTLNIAN